MAQIAKFRSQQRNQQSNNCGLNSQKHKSQEDSNLSEFANSNKYKAEKPQQSPKPYPNSKNGTNSRAKRSRILAYQPPHTPSGNSSKRVSIGFPKCVQTAQGPGSSSQHCTRKPSSPPPNVFIHKIDKGQSVGGSATVNRESNERYFFSYKRPTTNTLGALPQPTSHMTVPVSSSEEFNSFCHPFPPLPFYNPQQYTLTDWCHGGPVQQESHAPLEIPEQQQEKNQQQNMNSESMSSLPQSFEQGNLPGDSNFQAPQQSNESGWSILFKNIMDPINSVDSNKDSNMNNVQHMEANEMYGKINHKKQDGGQFILKGNETSRYSFPPNLIKKHSRDNFDTAKVSDTTGGHPAMQEENSSINDSLSEPINVTDVSGHEESGQSGCNTDEEMKSSTPGIMGASMHSLVFQSDRNKLDDAGKYVEGAPGIQFDERDKYAEARHGDFSSENPLVIDADSLTLREQGHDTQAGLDDDDGYSNLLAM
ncbi:uncharacterized protein [Hetaerina americana]|uniref:uncharacterized protein n=1 Tax=Hetaerina americana TaxID=62018 RepID=UPI003A7F3FAA